MASSSSSSSSNPVDLRHMTSSTVLATPSRTSQHLHSPSARLGSRSPNSIPSSPTSVHSSSSAIFERDIEPISVPSPPHHHHPANPHRIPRSKATEQLDQSVPSVLDSAAAALAAASPDDEDSIAVVAPAPGGIASPVLRSRSPSPSRAPTATLLLSVPSPAPGSVHPLPRGPSPAPPRPSIQTAVPLPHAPPAALSTPTSAYYSTLSSAESSPTTTTLEHPPPPPPPHPHSRTLSPAAPPSPAAAAKRLSFMSYADLLASTPASLLPLSALTSAAVDPPPHIPSVAGSAGGSARESVALLDDGGGEWEREGLGRGLEERLEALMTAHGRA